MLALVFYFLVSFTTTDGTALKPEDCCFVHPNYSGVCVVQPAEGETCSSILAYLNSPGTAGKAYCGNSPIRGGWAQVACQ